MLLYTVKVGTIKSFLMEAFRGVAFFFPFWSYPTLSILSSLRSSSPSCSSCLGQLPCLLCLGHLPLLGYHLPLSCLSCPCLSVLPVFVCLSVCLSVCACLSVCLSKPVYLSVLPVLPEPLLVLPIASASLQRGGTLCQLP